MSRRRDVAVVVAGVAGSVFLVVAAALPAAGQETPDPGSSPDGQQPADVAPNPPESADSSSNRSAPASTSSRSSSAAADEVTVETTVPADAVPLPVPAANVRSTRARNPDVWLGGGVVRDGSSPLDHAEALGGAGDGPSSPSTLDALLPTLMALATALLLATGAVVRDKQSVT